MKHEATERARQIVEQFVTLCIAHGYQPAQTCMLEILIFEALVEAGQAGFVAGKDHPR